MCSSDLVQRPRSPVAALYRAGYDELIRVKAAQGSDDAGGIENVERALRRATAKQTTVLESMVPFLATTGSTAPFIGLFGTVYGMIVAFQTVASSGGAADPVLLAGGIGTALVTTFWGLLIAIPALST